jgi:hypothetical protein
MTLTSFQGIGNSSCESQSSYCVSTIRPENLSSIRPGRTVDERFEYDELRMIGLVPEGNRLYYVAFVDRGKTRRVISLRPAERREVKHYVENYP